MKRSLLDVEKPLIEVIEELKVSGTWTVPDGCKSVDVFLVGGGGGGAYGAGGGGYTKIYTNVKVTSGDIIQYIIGAGGKYGGMNGRAQNGGISSFGGIEVSGGFSPQDSSSGYGGNGGSGGAGYTHATGGSDGNSGSHGNSVSNGDSYPGGNGQGASTRCPFNRKLYSTGGSTGRNITNPTGNWGDNENTQYRHGADNTGEGGSGSGWYGGNGGSGIIILRYKKYA